MFLFSPFGKSKPTTGSTNANAPLTPDPGPAAATTRTITTTTTAKADTKRKKPSCQRAAALTYLTAPYPVDSTDGVFEATLLLAASKLNASGSSTEERAEPGSWLGRAWKHVTDFSLSQRLKARQDDFIAAFSRQLELNPAEETSTVMVSCHCFIVSNGKLHYGTLFATNCGLYFCEPTLEGAAHAKAARYETSSASSADSSVIATAATAPSSQHQEEHAEHIKERVLFTDMASFLPSVFLPQKDDGPPFFLGIPNGAVAPTALQAFTVRLSTVIQFVGLHEVVVKPPRKTGAESEKTGSDGAATAAVPAVEAPCVDVVRKREYNLISDLPQNLDTLKFCALLWRLWAGRLEELGLPLENPAAHYAEPH